MCYLYVLSWIIANEVALVCHFQWVACQLYSQDVCDVIMIDIEPRWYRKTSIKSTISVVTFISIYNDINLCTRAKFGVYKNRKYETTSALCVVAFATLYEKWSTRFYAYAITCNKCCLQFMKKNDSFCTLIAD